MAIVGNLYKLETQFSNKGLSPVFEYLKAALDVESSVHQRVFSLPLGSFEKTVLGNGIFAYAQVAMTQDLDKCFIESHRNYVDFQLLLNGVEEMGYIDIDKLQVDAPYSKTKDLITYKMQENFSKFVLEPQDMALFFPEDGHIGLTKYKTESLIRKVVVKVPIELLVDV